MITYAFKSYTTLPKAIASRTLTEIHPITYGLRGVAVYTIEGSDMVLGKWVFPDYMNAVDGEAPWVTSYKLFANRASLDAYLRDTNKKPLVVQKNLKQWARNLKFEGAAVSASREIGSTELNKAAKAYHAEFNEWESKMREEVYTKYQNAE